MSRNQPLVVATVIRDVTYGVSCRKYFRLWLEAVVVVVKIVPIFVVSLYGDSRRHHHYAILCPFVVVNDLYYFVRRRVEKGRSSSSASSLI